MGQQVQLLRSNISGLADTLAEIDGLPLLPPEDVPALQLPTTAAQASVGTRYPPLSSLHRYHSPPIGTPLRAAVSTADAFGQHPAQQGTTNEGLPETTNTTALPVADPPMHAHDSALWLATTTPSNAQITAAVPSMATLPSAGSAEEEATAFEAGTAIAGFKEIKVPNLPPAST